MLLTVRSHLSRVSSFTLMHLGLLSVYFQGSLLLPEINDLTSHWVLYGYAHLIHLM